MNSKLCASCREDLPTDCFHADFRTASGLNSWCKTCSKTNARLRYQARRTADPKRVWARNAYWSARKRASDAGLPFDLTMEDCRRLAVDICPALGVPLDYDGCGRKGSVRYSASIDRVIPSLGYTVGNIRVLSMRANAIKTDATPAEVLAVARFMSQTLGSAPDH